VPDKEELIAKISARMIGQKQAIEDIAKLVRSQLARKPEKGGVKPMTILLPGPTGTGKTEISKAIARALDATLCRYDMGEYAEEFKASNLFGSPKGYVGSDDGGKLPNDIRTHGKGFNARMVILFDEVEKAHPSLWQKMLAFFDEGRCSDSRGEVIVPKDTILLMTTNIQAEQIAAEPEKAREIIESSGFFKPEFLGRIRGIIPMPRLDQAAMLELTERILESTVREYGLTIEVDDRALTELYLAVRDRAMAAGGRGISERVLYLLNDDLIDLQSDGHDRVRLVVKEGGKVGVIPA
jgi:ATP-dependent Clp protease ATP-binding subunit ClpA